MATLDFYNVTLTGTTAGQQIVNDFWYYQQTGTAGALELAEEFITQVLTPITDIICASTQFVHLKVLNHYDPVDFYDSDLSPVIPGLQPGPRAPIFVAMSFKQPRKIAGMNNGYKRFGTLAEADTNGDIVDSGALTRAASVAAAMSAIINSAFPSAVGSWTPVIIKREKYTTPSGSEAYRIPGSIVPGGYYGAVDWQLVNNLTTQNSRKLGHGA